MKAARIKKRLTQKQLAKNINVSQSYVSKIENRQQNIAISTDIIFKIAIELDMCPYKLQESIYNKCTNCTIKDCPKT